MKINLRYVLWILFFLPILSYANKSSVGPCDFFPSNYSKLLTYQKKELITYKKIDGLFNNIENNLCANKIVSAGINGEWNADEINYFQKKSVSLFENAKSLKICPILKGYSSNDLRSYFRFLFDSVKINKINDEMVGKCGTYVLENYKLAKKEYIEMRSTADNEDVSIRRYLGNEFLGNGEKIFLEKKIYFGNNLKNNRILLTTSKENHIKLYILKNLGDNTYYIFQSNTSFFDDHDLIDNNMLIVLGNNKFELHLKGVNKEKVLKFSFDEKMKLFKVITNDNFYKNNFVEKVEHCILTGDDFHNHDFRNKC